ncbi:terpene synthase family protein [Pseudonocardia sp. TRM90224]|uniref:terpene synthase family protein n=1 Tax=Pseudonocardia sp. TRM90224 TaxID=2812678 RepID=UPI001E29E9CE|nr:hypothetical protein [Pseudonocardia sp. TRM90224]
MATIEFPETERTFPASYNTLMDIPFRSYVNDELPAATPGHLNWMSGRGLLSWPDGVREYCSWRGPELGARWFPSARRPDLQLGMDVFGWLMVLDDSFDSLDLTPDDARRTVAQLEAVVHRPPGVTPPDGPAVVTAFADLWDRECVSMSPQWRRRAVVNWEEYFVCFVAETTNRFTSAELDIEEYLVLRDKSGIMYPLLDAIERIEGCELPDTVLAAEPVRQMRAACVWLCNIIQDVLSFEREQANGDLHNLVLVVEQQFGYGRQRAIDEIRNMIDEHVQQFLAAEARVPALLAELELAEELAEHLRTYVTTMRLQIRATDEWCRTSSRYSA